ncbi:MAG: PRC-barrel domain containing protein [Deltaproteobacteria bacterium]|nr:PRC-barrel domain containing protein [Deltaproteobacteria bacterium]
MLRSLQALTGYALNATDGKIGRCQDFLFDDQHWVLRYMVADTARWLPGRRVLIYPRAVTRADWQSRTIDVLLSKQQVEDAPALAEDQPVSRRYENRYLRYLGYGPYWIDTHAWGVAALPHDLPAAGDGASANEASSDIEKPEDCHLRSFNEIRGYRLDCHDDELFGSITDALVDLTSWTLRYVVVATRRILPGKEILVTPDLIGKLSYGQRTMTVDLTTEQLRNCPRFDPQAPVYRGYEVTHYDVYGRPTEADQ